MDISLLRSMILVAEHGSISAASKELFISSVALFKQINHLESEVGFKIFNRTNRGVTLTKPGERYYRGIKKLLADMDTLQTACRKMEAKAKKEIRACVYWPFNLNPYIKAYGKLHPDVSFVQTSDAYLTEVSCLSPLMNDHLDLIQLDYEPQNMTDDLVFMPFLHDCYSVVCAKDHPVADHPFVTLDDLCKYELSISLDISSPVPLQKKLESLGKTLHGDSSTNLDIITKCNEGHLYIMDGEYARTMEHFCAIPIEPEWPFIHGIVYKKDAPAHVLDFVEFVREQVGEGNVSQMEALLGIE